MKIRVRHHITLIFFLFTFSIVAQENNADMESKKVFFMVRGQVLESDTNNPIPKVNIEVNGGAYTSTDLKGEFRIQAKVGDELVIKHSEFETVYYTIKNNERITVSVQPGKSSLFKQSASKIRDYSYQDYRSTIDSADYYLRLDAKKSIQFVTDAIANSTSKSQNAEAYELLGDIHFYWKQYDLAVTNYRISLQSESTNNVRLKLGNAYNKNGNYQESLSIFNVIDADDLSNWQKIELYEGFGDVYINIGNYTSAINNYKKGLEVANTHLIKPKSTDLTSKIAQTYELSGANDEAEDYYGQSLDLASQENKRRAIEEKVKVADFENRSGSYEDEIKLRQEVIEEIDDIELDSIIDNESAITSQKQNYKIGNAYFLQNDLNNAIPYLEKSIEEAEESQDLVVKKDATRKLSEVYRDAGDFDKAQLAYSQYMELVDALYIKKEQEISQATRFRNDLFDKQNRINSLESDRALSKTIYELSEERNKRQEIIIFSLIGGVLLLLIAGYFMYKSIRQQKLANNLLALKSLRSQMNPHFIFNALNSVNSFIANNDERTANKYLSDFSLLMRAVLENSEEDFIPLDKEIELLEMYTKLEHFRFKDKFDYKIIIEDSVSVDEFQIPPMLLQPYIENAVWHGLRYKNTKGNLHITISQPKTEQITITIADDGIGRKKSKAMKTENQKKHNSKGLSNIKKRVEILNEMYKDKVDVFIEDYQPTEDTGTKVVVTLKKD